MRGRPSGSRELSLSQIEEIKDLTEEGMSRKKIAISVGCSHDTVWRYQKKLGLI